MKLYGLQNKEKSSLEYSGGEIKEGLLQGGQSFQVYLRCSLKTFLAFGLVEAGDLLS